MSALDLAAERSVRHIAARLNARPDDTHRVLASLGLAPYAGAGFAPLPTKCGHPSTSLKRNAMRKGVACIECEAVWRGNGRAS